MNQKGFATLEIILVVMVIGILASIAVPRFTDITAKANTAKIQSDLTTLDTAISIYYMEYGDYPTALSQLSSYVRDIGNVKPPTGDAYVKGNTKQITGTAYEIKTVGTESRATLNTADGENVAGDFYQTKNSSTTTTSGT